MSGHWQGRRDEYKTSSWSDMPSIFAEFAANYLPKSGKLVDLGSGLGQDSLYFSTKGFDVISTDIVLDTKFSMPSNIQRQVLDIGQPFNLGDSTFDVVYAHLSLHYFDKKTTEKVFSEIYRILKPGGTFAFLANSIDDPEYNTGTKIEEYYFDTEGTKKRYFNVVTAREFTKNFETIICDNNGETYKDRVKGVQNLVRFIGVKPE